MSKSKRWWALALASLCSAATAHATSFPEGPNYEPNETVATAYGPLGAETNYPSALSSGTDVDVYYVGATMSQTIDFTVANDGEGLDSPCSSINAQVLDDQGTLLKQTSVVANSPQSLVVDTMDAQRLYLRLSATGGCDAYFTYHVSVASSQPLLGPPAPVDPKQATTTTATTPRPTPVPTPGPGTTPASSPISTAQIKRSLSKMLAATRPHRVRENHVAFKFQAATAGTLQLSMRRATGTVTRAHKTFKTSQTHTLSLRVPRSPQKRMRVHVQARFTTTTGTGTTVTRQLTLRR